MYRHNRGQGIVSLYIAMQGYIIFFYLHLYSSLPRGGKGAIVSPVSTLNSFVQVNDECANDMK